MVAGNNDIPEKFSDQNDKAIISNLKKSQTIEINNQLISVEHGDRFGHHADHNGLRQSYPDSRVDVAAEGHKWYRVVFTDMFVLSLVVTSTFGLAWSYLQFAGS